MSVGKSIKTERKKKNLTIQDVASMSEITPSIISQIENGKGNPSLNTLKAIARAIGVTVSTFFNGESSHFNSPIVRGSERPVMSKSKGFTNYQLSPGTIDSFCVYYTVLEPNASTINSPEHHPVSSTGYEFGYILNGKLSIDVEGQIYILNPGDSICIDTTKHHSSTNISTANCEMLWFMIP